MIFSKLLISNEAVFLERLIEEFEDLTEAERERGFTDDLLTIQRAVYALQRLSNMREEYV